MTKEERLKKRHSAEKRFRFYGIASIFVALLFVLILVHNIFSKGSSAFMKTAINVEVFFDPELIDVQNGASIDEIMQSDFFDITIETLLKTYPVNDFDQENELIDLFTTDAELEIKRALLISNSASVVNRSINSFSWSKSFTGYVFSSVSIVISKKSDCIISSMDAPFWTSMSSGSKNTSTFIAVFIKAELPFEKILWTKIRTNSNATKIEAIP